MNSDLIIVLISAICVIAFFIAITGCLPPIEDISGEKNMGMCMALQCVSDINIKKILNQPELIWRLVSYDDPEIYEEAIEKHNKPSFFSKLFGKTNPVKIEAQELKFEDGENIEEDLDKAWHGIHFCLNGSSDEAKPPMDFLTVGGELAGHIDVGIGPARLINSQAVREINRIISDISKEQLKEQYSPRIMVNLGIYPNIWERDQDEGFEYLAHYFEILKKFISKCTDNNLGIAVYLC